MVSAAEAVGLSKRTHTCALHDPRESNRVQVLIFRQPDLDACRTPVSHLRGSGRSLLLLPAALAKRACTSSWLTKRPAARRSSDISAVSSVPEPSTSISRNQWTRRACRAKIGGAVAKHLLIESVSELPHWC